MSVVYVVDVHMETVPISAYYIRTGVSDLTRSVVTGQPQFTIPEKGRTTF